MCHGESQVQSFVKYTTEFLCTGEPAVNGSWHRFWATQSRRATVGTADWLSTPGGRKRHLTGLGPEEKARFRIDQSRSVPQLGRKRVIDEAFRLCQSVPSVSEIGCCGLVHVSDPLRALSNTLRLIVG